MQFCSCPSTLWPFHERQDSMSPFGCQFDRAPIFQQFFGRFRLQNSCSDCSGCFSGNCTASYSKIMQNRFYFWSQFLGYHISWSGTFRGDFISSCCFLIYVLSVIKIATITNHFPFKYITLVGVRVLFMSCWYPCVCWRKSQPLVLYPQEKLVSFSSSLFVASMRSVLLQHTPGYWTLHRLMSATLHQTGSHCPHIQNRNLWSWLSDKTTFPQIVHVQNALIFIVFVSFVLFEWVYKYVMSFHCMVYVARNNVFPLQ